MSENGVAAGSIEQLLARVLDGGYSGVATRVLGAVASSTTSGQVERDMDALTAEAARLAESGERLTVDNPAIRAVLSSVDVAMRDNVVRIRDASGELQTTGVRAAEVLTRQLMLPGLSDEQLEVIGIEFNQPNPETVMRLVELVDSPAFGDALTGLSETVVQTVANQAIRGVALGWNPLRVAREISRVTGSYPRVLADTMMRTLYLESYRTSTAAYQNANSDIIRRVIRVESLDDRICMACIGLHGTVVWDAQINEGQAIPKIAEHRNGRGTTITETILRPINIQSGVDWWASQDDATRRRLAGPAAFNALNAGAVRVEDFIGEQTDDLFGDMIFEQSVVGILGDDAGQYYEGR